jgi:hypothetical protein
VFGLLTVYDDSFLDFGTGATGELRFGEYTPSALLTVYNFLPGNLLVFVGSDLSGLIDDPGLFSFQGGFQSAWDEDTSTFTVTAIPEASTWFAAMLLVALCAGGLWRTLKASRWTLVSVERKTGKESRSGTACARSRGWLLSTSGLWSGEKTTGGR